MIREEKKIVQHETRSEGRKEGARNAELGKRKEGREEIEPRDLANKRGRKEGTSRGNRRVWIAY